MAQCAYCGTETELHEGNTSICVQCADMSPEGRMVRTRLFLDFQEAVKVSELANENFAMAAKATSGTQAIHDASRQLTAARDALIKAGNRLNDFLKNGTVPDDLKRSG